MSIAGKSFRNLVKQFEAYTSLGVTPKGLEVIQEETESQMSSDSDQELEPLHDYGYNDVSSSRRKSSGLDCVDHIDHFGVNDFGGGSTDILAYPHDDDADHQDDKCTPGEILTKHIRISAKDFDPVSVHVIRLVVLDSVACH